MIKLMTIKALLLISLISYNNYTEFSEIKSIEENNMLSEDKHISDIQLNKESYLKKIWIDTNKDYFTNPGFSFTISEITKDMVKGKFAIASIAKPEFDYSGNRYKVDLQDFEIPYTDNKILIEYDEDNGNKVKAKIEPINHNKIKVTIEHLQKDEDYKYIQDEGVFIYQPFNINKYNNFQTFEDKSFTVNLKKWGSVKFVVGEDLSSNKKPVDAFLINDEGDIIYTFNNAFPNNYPIEKVTFVDANKDSLQDLIILLGESGDGSGERVRIFFQNKDGTFYANQELNKEIFYLDNIYTLDDLLEFLESKF